MCSMKKNLPELQHYDDIDDDNDDDANNNEVDDNQYYGLYFIPFWTPLPKTTNCSPLI